MPKNLFLAALAAAVVVGIGYADQSTKTIVVPAGKTSADSGKQMYMSYCATCHGVDGKGNGPVAPALKKQPTDLTVLSRNNGGKFPSQHVEAVLEFGAQDAAHGSAQMPIWGTVFNKMDTSPTQQDLRALRISNLNRYLETIQAK